MSDKMMNQEKRMGSARVSRAGFGVSPKRTSALAFFLSRGERIEVRERPNNILFPAFLRDLFYE
jgi:hypothetical protein